MTQEIIALVAGAVLSVAALAYVLQPLFFPQPPKPSPAAARPPADDAIEARLRELRSRHVSCEQCGVRPEPDAVYCSSCGRPLNPAATARSY